MGVGGHGWRWAVAGMGALAAIAAGVHTAVTQWSPDELGPDRGVTEVPALAPRELRVVTLNAWRLSAPARVPALVAALDGIGGALARADSDRPELIAIQELQSREAVGALERELGDAYVASCICSLREDGSVREAIAAAVRAPLQATSHECIELGAIFPDHARCAVLVRVETPEGERIDFASTHLAWHPANASMIETLRSELGARAALGPRTVIAGDFNAWPGGDSYGAMVRAPLADARPGSARTHFAGGRVDYVLHGAGLEVVRGIDRRRSFEIVRPVARFTIPSACASEGPPACGISDHLPEGVVLRPSGELGPVSGARGAPARAVSPRGVAPGSRRAARASR